MSTSPISTAPPEVLHQVLKYLPIATLLRFGQTSKQNYSAATLALQNLRLAVFPRHLHGVLAFLSSSTFDEFDADIGASCYDDPCRNQVIVTSPVPTINGALRSKTKAPARTSLTTAQHREKIFQLQNTLACSILSSPPLACLTSLTLHLYHITSPSLTEVLATLLPNVRDLRLNFYHPYLHDTCLPAQYWTNPVHLQPSPIWNALAGIGDKSNVKLRLRRLERLTIERAGITSFQLRKWIECNPDLGELRLRNVAGVDAEFVQWLGRYYGPDNTERSDGARPVKLRTLALENCSALTAESVEALGWLDSLFGLNSNEFHDQDNPAALRILSLRYSASVKTTALCEYLEAKRPAVQQVTLPDGRVLGRKVKTQKRSRSEPSSMQSRTSVVSKKKRRARTQTTEPSPNNMGVQNPLHIDVEPSTMDINVQALTIDDTESDEDESSDDETSPFSSPVSYLRLTNRRRPRKGRNSMPNDIIEPDPDAI